MVSQFPPRPILIQTGYNDKRVGTEYCLKFAAKMEEAYRKADAIDNFKLQVLPFVGHESDAVYEPVIDGNIAWLKAKGF